MTDINNAPTQLNVQDRSGNSVPAVLQFDQSKNPSFQTVSPRGAEQVFAFDGVSSLWRAIETDNNGSLYSTPSLMIARPSIVGTVSAVPTAKQVFGDGILSLRYLRGTVNASNSSAAAIRLLGGFPDVFMLTADKLFALQSSVNITRLDLAGFSTANGAATPGLPVVETATEAEMTARMVTFIFLPQDNVRTLVITSSQNYSAAAAVATATNFVMTLVEGRSHAQ